MILCASCVCARTKGTDIHRLVIGARRGMLGAGERKLEQVAAWPLPAGGGFVALAGTVPAEFQRLLRAGLLWRPLLSGTDGLVAAFGDAGGHRHFAKRALLP